MGQYEKQMALAFKNFGTWKSKHGFIRVESVSTRDKSGRYVMERFCTLVLGDKVIARHTECFQGTNHGRSIIITTGARHTKLTAKILRAIGADVHRIKVGFMLNGQPWDGAWTDMKAYGNGQREPLSYKESLKELNKILYRPLKEG